jgi:hypothetical protein
MFYLKSFMAPTVDLSSCEGEIGAAIEMTKDTIFFRGVLKELGQEQLPRSVLRHAAGVRGDIRKALEVIGPDAGYVTIITGKQSIPLLQEEFQRSVHGVQVLRAMTPQDALRRMGDIRSVTKDPPTSFEEYAAQLVSAGEVEVPRTMRARLAEGPLRPLFRGIERMTGGAIDVERLLHYHSTIPLNGDRKAIDEVERMQRELRAQEQPIVRQKRRHSGR